MFWCILILVFHDLLIVGNLADLLFIYLLFDCFAISVIFHILGFFYRYLIQFINDLFIIIAHFFLCTSFEISAMDNDSIEICSPFVWFSRRNCCVNFILWIRVGVSLPVVDMLYLFFGI
ncbi:hypothetical protein AMTRI_Chr13g122160 [Amborella trichopoda]